jgi:hypothetical protein
MNFAKSCSADLPHLAGLPLLKIQRRKRQTAEKRGLRYK